MERKRCGLCEEIKPNPHFYPYKINGLQRYCKICDKERKYEKLVCECGKFYTKTHFQRHLRSKYHTERESI